VVIGLAAFLEFLSTNRSPVYSPPPFAMDTNVVGDANTAVNITGIDLYITPNPHLAYNYGLSIWISSQSQTADPIPLSVFLSLTLPSNATIPDCAKPKCLTSKGIGANMVTYSFDLPSPYITGNNSYWYGGVHIPLHSDNFAFTAKGANLEGQLPAMTASVYAQTVPQTPLFHFIYTIPTPSAFDWVGGPTPTTDHDHVQWTETAAGAAQSVAISTIDRGADRADSNRTFIAGLLAATAGGAFIGTLQEFLRVQLQDPEPSQSIASYRRRLKSIKTVQSEARAVKTAVDLFGPHAGPSLAKAIRSGAMSVDDFVSTPTHGHDATTRTPPE
jgi:hypothetical protein